MIEEEYFWSALCTESEHKVCSKNHLTPRANTMKSAEETMDSTTMSSQQTASEIIMGHPGDTASGNDQTMSASSEEKQQVHEIAVSGKFSIGDESDEDQTRPSEGENAEPSSSASDANSIKLSTEADSGVSLSIDTSIERNRSDDEKDETPKRSPTQELKSKSTSLEKSSELPPKNHPPKQKEADWQPFSNTSLFHEEAQPMPSNSIPPPSLERSSSLIADLTTLRHIFDTEYERAIEHQEIAWKARYAATRISFLISSGCMLLYLWGGCMFYSHEAGWSVPDALLFTVYTVTTVGYGGPRPLPNTAAFHAFTSFYVLVGISGVTVLGAHTYQLITLEATRMRTRPKKKRRQQTKHEEEEAPADGFDDEDQDPALERFRQQFMSELEDRVREQPSLDRALDGVISRFKEVKHYMETTKCGRVLAVILPFVGLIMLGAIVVGLIEGWTPLGKCMTSWFSMAICFVLSCIIFCLFQLDLESIYWSIVTLTTVGYGDYTPNKNSSVWFCTLFFIPSSLFFLSFFLTHVAKSYIKLHAIHVTRLERRMRNKAQMKRDGAKRAEHANQIAKSGDNDAPSKEVTPKRSESADAEELENGFTTISYTEDEDMGNTRRTSMSLFGEGTGMDNSSPTNASNSIGTSSGLRYRESVLRNKFTAPDPNSKRAISFVEALKSLNDSSNTQSSGESSQHDQEVSSRRDNSGTPSLEIRMRVQERIARIIADEVAGFQDDVTIKGSTVSLTISTLRDTFDKWQMPPQAWKAFRAISFRCLLFVGERDLISDGGDSLFQLNAIEFHGIFSPMLAAMGDGPSMEEWLAQTDILADAEFGDVRGRVARGNVSPHNVFRGTFT